MTRSVPVFDTATKSSRSEDQHTLSHVLAAAEVREVQLMPSRDVMTSPDKDTATKTARSGDQHTDDHGTSAAAVRAVQVAPFEDVITRLPVPVLATATKIPSCEDQHTEFH